MIRTEHQEGLHILRLPRPEKANALTAEMLSAIAGAARNAAAAEDARLLILTGEGKVFSAGADLDAVKDGLSENPVWDEAAAAISAFPGLSIAALNGTLAGGAFGLALACDLRIATESAQMFYPVMKRGYLPRSQDVRRLTALIGPSRMRQILLTGRRLTADEALDWGLVDRISEGEDLISAALNLAWDAKEAETAHIHRLKALIRDSEGED